MTRVFTALPVPAGIAEEVMNPIPDRNAGKIRWIDPETAHLTLEFLGSLPDHDVEAVAEALAGIALPPIAVELVRVESYPSRGRPRVIVVEPLENARLLRLHESVRRTLGHWLRENDRPYRPHVTIGRLVKYRHVDTAAIERAVRSTLPRSFDAHRFHLYSSETKPDGAHYSTLRDFPLSE